MSKMFSKLFKRFRRNDTVSKASSTTTQLYPFRSLKNHLAATKIQLAFRQYKKRCSTKVRGSCGINAGCMPEKCNKLNTPVERMAVSIMPATSISSTSWENLDISSTSSENLESSDIPSAHQGHSPILRHFTLRRLLRVHATMLRYLRSMIRINPSQKANNEDQKSDTMVKVDHWKLHLEPKSRNRTLQPRIQHVSILDCYGLCSSTPHFTSSESSAEDPNLVPVYLNVYDMTPVNACLYWLGLGIHHSGVQVYGVEYAFGIDEEGTTGVFMMEPRNCEGFKFKKEILVGYSKLRAEEVENVISELAEQFRRYHLITNNCNHFSTQACLRLTANSIPPWVNRLARIGSLFVKSGNWSRNKILACNCKAKDAASKKNRKVLSRLMKFNSSSFSSGSSEVTFTVPAYEQQYSEEVNYASEMEPSRAELSDYKKACAKLWELDLNRLTPGTDYELDVGEGKKVYGREDMAESSLFTWVSEEVLRKPTFSRFCALLDNYNPHEGVKENVTAQERQEQSAFIEEISRTAPIKYLHKYLNSRGIFTENFQEFKRMLTDLWFTLYGRGGTSGSSSSFEHVFVGEIKERGEQQVSGFHNWLQFYLEEAKGRVDYQGFILPRRRGQFPDSETQLITVQFEWNGVLKSVSSMFVGVSPEFEVALYTLCFFAGGEENHVEVGPYPVNVKCYRLGNKIGSAFPIAEE